jgi:hypothetical protein
VASKVRFPLDEAFEHIAADYRRAVANEDEVACEAARAALAIHAQPHIARLVGKRWSPVRNDWGSRLPTLPKRHRISREPLEEE